MHEKASLNDPETASKTPLPPVATSQLYDVQAGEFRAGAVGQFDQLNQANRGRANSLVGESTAPQGAVEPHRSSHDFIEEGSMMGYYVDPEGTDAQRKADGLPPVDQSEYQAWLESLDSETIDDLNNQKEQFELLETKAQETRQKILGTAPELYKAKLPAELERRLGDIPYAIGFNQSATEGIDEAEKLVKDLGGVDLAGYSLSGRFLMYDQSSLEADDSSISSAIERGYTGNSDVGRFVVAFPVAHTENFSEDASVVSQIAMEPEQSPDDLLTVENGETQDVVNSKYIAGYIDDEGNFWQNENFNRSTQPQFELKSEQKKTAEQAKLKKKAILDNGIIASERSEAGQDFSLDLLAGQIVTDIIVETDDGKMHLLKHEGPKGNATRARFEITTATDPEVDNERSENARTLPLTRQEIEGVTLKVGEPIVFGSQPDGKSKRTLAKVTRVTAWNSHRKALAEDSPRRTQLKASNARQEFDRRLKTSRE